MTSVPIHPWRFRPGPARPADPGPAGKPAIPAIPGGPLGQVRALAAQALIRRIATRVPVHIQAADGSVYGCGAAGAPVLEIHRADAFYRRLGAGTAGLAESYMAGDWDSPDLVGARTVPGMNSSTSIRRSRVVRSPGRDE